MFKAGSSNLNGFTKKKCLVAILMVFFYNFIVSHRFLCLVTFRTIHAHFSFSLTILFPKCRCVKTAKISVALRNSIQTNFHADIKRRKKPINKNTFSMQSKINFGLCEDHLKYIYTRLLSVHVQWTYANAHATKNEHFDILVSALNQQNCV